MKKILGIFFYLAAFSIVSGQSISTIEKELDLSFQKINHWYADLNNNINSYDSLTVANNQFEKLLLKHTSNPKTMRYDFKSLRKNGLQISSSEDGRFRIYSWDTWNGGTMHFFKNIFQYESDNKVYSTTIGDNSEMNAQCFYYQINDIISQDKKYYLAQSTAIYSSALTSHSIKVFSIDNGKLNSDAKLIKTKTGIRNQLGYEIDLSAKSNLDNEIRNYDIEYDAKKKIISIPLILDDYKVTEKKYIISSKANTLKKYKMKKIIALIFLVLTLTLYNYPIFDDKKITFAVIFLCFVVIVFLVAKLYSSDEKEDYDSVEKEMDRLHEDNGIFEYTNDGFYFKHNNITEFIKWDEIIAIFSFRIPSPFSERKQSGLEIITDRKNYEFDYSVTPGIVKLTDQLYNYLPDWKEDSPMEINNFGLEKTKLYERKAL